MRSETLSPAAILTEQHGRSRSSNASLSGWRKVTLALIEHAPQHEPMRALIVIIGLIAAGSATFFWSQRVAEISAPPSSAEPMHRARGETRSPDASAVRAQRPAAETVSIAPSSASAPATVANNPTEATPPPPSQQTAPRSTILTARDLVTNNLLPNLRWRFSYGVEVIDGVSTTGVAELPLPTGVTGDLLIEADEMQPQTLKRITAIAAPAPPLKIDAYLRPTVTGEGIRLMIRDDQRRPVRNARVDAFALDDANRDGAWQLGPPLWSRRASAADGNYQLPALPPGEYGVQVRATNDAGALQPLAPFRSVYSITGSNGYLEEVNLSPACALRLELLDLSGEPFDPTSRGVVTVTLQGASARVVQRKWTGASGDGGTITAVDQVPTRAPIWLAAPVAPGAYTLEVRAEGALLARQLLNLSASSQTEQVIIP